MRRRDHRDRERDRDRDRDRHRGDRKRGVEKEMEKSGSTSGDNPKPFVLLKRPETIASSSQGITSSSELPKKDIPVEIRPNKEGSQSTKPGVILLRPSLRAESFPDLRGAGESPLVNSASAATTGDTSSAPDVKTLYPKSATKSQPAVNIPEVKRPYQPNLKHAIPLINATDKMTVVQESELEFIGPNANSQDFFVITAVGKPQSGKSTILSYLASGEKFGGKEIFLKRKLCQEKECSVYITSNNIIFIEMASVFNGAATNDMMSLMPQSTLEIATINWNMRILNWALSVSHLVLVVSESLVDPNFLQLLNSSAMVHPVESVFGDGCVAEIAFVCNKASNSMLEDEQLQSVSEYVFNSALGRPSTISRSFFVLPSLQTKSHNERFSEFRDRIEDFVRYNRAMHKMAKFPQNITMSTWLNSCSRIWSEDLGNSPGFSSYVKLLP